MDSKTITVYKNPLESMPFKIDLNVEYSSYKKHLLWKGDRAENDRDAFEISLNKFQLIILEDIDNGGSTSTCGLCHIYKSNRNYYYDCEGCPVMKQTGKPYCYGSPYEDWSDYPCEEFAVAQMNFLVKLAQSHGYTVVYEQ